MVTRNPNLIKAFKKQEQSGKSKRIKFPEVFTNKTKRKSRGVKL